MQPRQKTEEEIAQERSDEEFARQLQEQLNETPSPIAAPASEAQASQPQSRSWLASSTATVQMSCPNCGALNHLPATALTAAGQRQSYRCGSCTQLLPVRGAHHNGSGIPPPMPGMSHITCQNCRSINQVPVGATTQFLCGDCHRLLTFNVSPQSLRQPAVDQVAPGYPAAASSSTSAAGSPPPQQPTTDLTSTPSTIYEGRVAQKSIQVRCGQCQTVNHVKVSGNQHTVEFACTSCLSTNEVDL